MTDLSEHGSFRRMYASGLPATDVEPGASCIIETWPQALVFEIDKLVVSPDVLDDFLIEDVVVGTTSQFGSLQPVHARTCDATDYKFPHEFTTKCRLGHHVFVKVINVSNKRKTFRGGLVGMGVFEA